MDLGIRLRDSMGGIARVYKVKEADMFISGTEIEGDAGIDTCYLAVFKSQSIATETWFVGNVFMREQYVVYDMTPKDNDGKDYIQVGVAF